MIRSWYKCPECTHRVLAADWETALKVKCTQHPGAIIRPDLEANAKLGVRTGDLKQGWCDGKKIYQLEQSNPDHVVHSESEMQEAYERNGLSMDTGGYIDESARINAGSTERFKRVKYKKNRTEG